MDLFGKDRDLVHRLINLILVLWMAGALFFVLERTINILVKEPTYTFDEYKIGGCAIDLYIKEDEVAPVDKELDCEVYYEQYLSNIKDNDYNYTKELIIAGGNFVIVGLYVFLLNKKTSK